VSISSKPYATVLLRSLKALKYRRVVAAFSNYAWDRYMEKVDLINCYPIIIQLSISRCSDASEEVPKIDWRIGFRCDQLQKSVNFKELRYDSV